MCNFPTLDGQKTRRNTSVFSFFGVNRAHNGFTIVPVGLKTRSVGELVAQGHRCSSLHYISNREERARLCESYICLLDAHFDIFLQSHPHRQTLSIWAFIILHRSKGRVGEACLLSAETDSCCFVFFFQQISNV